MKEILKNALLALIDKKSIVGIILGAIIALAAQLSGLSPLEVQESVCEQKVEIQEPAK
jgi:hypothetical protein